MIWTVIFAMLMTAFAGAMIHYRSLYFQAKDNARGLEIQKYHLQNQLEALQLDEKRRRERIAYQAGLYDGRETDILYRSMLRKQQQGERITVMLNKDDTFAPLREELVK